MDKIWDGTPWRSLVFVVGMKKTNDHAELTKKDHPPIKTTIYRSLRWLHCILLKLLTEN